VPFRGSGQAPHNFTLERTMDLVARELSVPDGGHVSSDPRVRVATLEFLGSVVQHVRDSAVTVAWQVENEPLDAAGPHRWSIEPRFLAEEVSLVRQLDPHNRPVIVNAFVETQPRAQVGTAREALLTRARRRWQWRTFSG
jgi:hypothetical protein